MTLFVSIAGRRWPCEETFKAGKDIHGWDQCQARGFEAICRHSALTALAQLRHAAIRNALCGDITVTASSQQQEEEEEEGAADLGIPLGDAPVPSRPGQPCPSGIAVVSGRRRRHAGARGCRGGECEHRAVCRFRRRCR